MTTSPATADALTFPLHGNVGAIVVNALTDQAHLLDQQALEQEAAGNASYAMSLRAVAVEAQQLTGSATEQLS